MHEIATAMRPLLAIDWGTSSVRGARLGPMGEVLESREFSRGILSVSQGQFEFVLNELFGDWLQNPDALCLISGMAGSRQGWHEAPYCPCPAGFTELGQHLLWVKPGRMALVPGLSCMDSQRSPIPDVMRGEEVQIFGALQLSQRDTATLVLPGTHSKWVQVQDGHVTDFSTFMTGELYALLSQYSILSKTLDLQADFDAPSFLEGIDQSHQPGSVLHHLFAVRTLGLFGRKPSSSLPSFLSGLLIGEELRHQTKPPPNSPVILIGSNALTMHYTLALQHLGIESQSFGPEATWAGLFALASSLPLRS